MISVTRGEGPGNRSRIAIHFGLATRFHVSLEEAEKLATDLLERVQRMRSIGRTP